MPSEYGAPVLPSDLLQQLPLGITHLELDGRLSDAALRGLSRLTNCSHLALKGDLGSPSLYLAELQELQGLTLLRLSASHGGQLHYMSLPDFSRFTALQYLHIQACGASNPKFS